MSTQKNYSGSLALTKLQSALMTTKKGTKCLLIPIDENYLTQKDNAIYLNVNVIVREEQDQYGQNGFISHKLSSEKYKEIGKEKANELNLPILGNIKNFAIQNNDAENVTVIAEIINPEDADLPF